MCNRGDETTRRAANRAGHGDPPDGERIIRDCARDRDRHAESIRYSFDPWQAVESVIEADDPSDPVTLHDAT